MKYTLDILTVGLFVLTINCIGLSQFYLESGDDVSLTRHGHLRIGAVSSENMAIDVNEIQARNNGLASPLFLNLEGGIVQFGRDVSSGRINMQRYSDNGIRNLWVDNDGFLRNEKREKHIRLGASRFQSLDSEKDFIFNFNGSIQAKNNQNNTGIILHMPFPTGTEISAVSVALRDPNETNKLCFRIYESNGWAVFNTWFSEDYINSGATGLSWATFDLSSPIILDGTRDYLLVAKNCAGHNWEDNVYVSYVAITYMEP